MSFFVEQNPWIFLILTVILGGAAAFMSGRAMAKGWKSPWILACYMVLFTAGIRFLHFALFEAQLSSLQYFFSHGIIVFAAAFLGYRLTLAQQMASKYPWAYELTSPLTWREKK